MLFLIVIVMTVLLVLISAWLKVKKISIRSIIASPVKDILILDVMLSVSVSLAIVSTDVAFSCDTRYIDIVINVSNTMYFSIISGYLAAKVITRPRIAYFIVKIIVPVLLVIVQIVLAGIAHFAKRKERGETLSVHFCYDERGTTLVRASYCYGLALLVVCIALMIFKLYRSRRYSKRSGKIEMICIALLSTLLGVLYLVSLFFVLFDQDEADCGRHADSLVILSLFPAITSLLGFSCGITKLAYKKIKWCCLQITETRMILYVPFAVRLVSFLPFRENGKRIAISESLFTYLSGVSRPSNSA